MKAILVDWVIAALAYIAICVLFTAMDTDDEVASKAGAKSHHGNNVRPHCNT